MVIWSTAMRRPVSFGLRAIVLVLLAAGVASAAGYLLDHWTDPQRKRQPYKKFVVITITRDVARRRFEDRFVSLLRGRNAQAMTSYAMIPDFDKAGEPEEYVGKLLADTVDAVITVRLTPMDGRTIDDWTAAWHAELEQPLRGRDYIIESLKRPVDPKVETYGGEVAIWDLQSGHRIWAARSIPMKLEDLREQSTPIVQAVIDQLRYENLL